jgi:hypothetical protein
MKADLRAVTERCRARLARLELPRPFDVRVLCARTGERRGRPLRLIEASLPDGGPRGLWISTERADYIVYEQETSVLHQEHIILHELSHLLCGHTGHAEFSTEHLDRLFPTLDRTTVGRVLGRACYSSEEEQEAEILASLILQHASLHHASRAPHRGATADPAAGENLRRLENGL